MTVDQQVAERIAQFEAKRRFEQREREIEEQMRLANAQRWADQEASRLADERLALSKAPRPSAMELGLKRLRQNGHVGELLANTVNDMPPFGRFVVGWVAQQTGLLKPYEDMAVHLVADLDGRAGAIESAERRRLGVLADIAKAQTDGYQKREALDRLSQFAPSGREMDKAMWRALPDDTLFIYECDQREKDTREKIQRGTLPARQAADFALAEHRADALLYSRRIELGITNVRKPSYGTIEFADRSFTGEIVPSGLETGFAYAIVQMGGRLTRAASVTFAGQKYLVALEKNYWQILCNPRRCSRTA